MNVDEALLTELLQTKDSGQKLSIYMPTHPVSSGQTVQEDGIRFKNALQAIRSSEAYDEAALGDTMITLDELVDNEDFWNHQAMGLALFADQQGYRAVHLSYDLTEANYIGEQYQVSPLVLMESLGSNHYILDINHSRPRLLESTPAGCKELELEDMPESLESMMENVEFRQELQTQHGGTGAFHGHNDKAALQDNMMRYYRAIAAAVDKYLADHTDPLVYVGVENRIGTVRQILSYKHTLEEYVEGSGEAMNEQALREKTLPIVERYHKKRRDGLIEDFKATAPQFAAIGEVDVNTAVAEGRAARLLLPSFRRTADTVRDVPDESIVLQLDEEDSATEALVRATLAQGGEVVAVPVDAFDDSQPRVLCRY